MNKQIKYIGVVLVAALTLMGCEDDVIVKPFQVDGYQEYGYTVKQFDPPIEISAYSFDEEEFDVDNDGIMDFKIDGFGLGKWSHFSLTIEVLNKSFKVATLNETDTTYVCTTYNESMEIEVSHYYNESSESCDGEEKIHKINPRRLAPFLKSKNDLFEIDYLWSGEYLILKKSDGSSNGVNSYNTDGGEWVDGEMAYVFFKNKSHDGWFKLQTQGSAVYLYEYRLTKTKKIL